MALSARGGPKSAGKSSYDVPLSARPFPRRPNELQGADAGNLLHRFELGVQELNREIRQDEEGLKELLRHLKFLEREQQQLKKAYDEASEKYQGYEAAGASFVQEYSNHLETTHRTYNYVRQKHSEAVQILSNPDSFAYHQAYKKGDNSFSGTYFTPKPLKRAEERKSNAQKKVDRLAKSGALPPVGA
eukprot:TRINITY_DN10588_c0_g1_i1.p1 TRINITY_DN10588_c0_g1~~TRINITY_DN10588_c0_g1_i1.p1  ORF type:complete len:188 (+),score=49.66 TRINITY_DN10588_c0_g1_i1:108-671(+)